MALFFDGALPVQLAMYVFANLMLAGLGLYLLGITRYIGWFERAGVVLWRRVQPVMRHVMPANTMPRALGLGALWGWMPCGLVYSILATALLTGHALQGAALMFAFGLGTLPNLLFAGALMRWLAARRAGTWMRRASGATVLLLGVAGIAHASVAGQHAIAAFLCFTPG
jgi:sulfite exporter TauE/SafE